MTDVLTDEQYQQRLARARCKDAEMSRIEKEAGWAQPQHCDLHCHLRTAESALECGVMCNDWDTVCEGIVLLQQAIARLMPPRVNERPS